MSVFKKPVFSISILIVVVLTLNSCGIFSKQVYDISKVDDAIAYNDLLINEEIIVIDKINILDSVFETYEPVNIEPALNAAKEQIKKSIKKIKKIKAFYGDDSFKEALITFLKFFDNQLNNQYAEMLEIYELPIEEYTEKEESRYNFLIDEIDTDYDKEFKIFTDIQDAFAEKFGFTLY